MKATWLFAQSMVATCALSAATPSMAQQVNQALVHPPALRAITVNAASDLGTMKPLRGVNSGPLPWTDRLEAERLSGEVEVSDRDGYRSLAADASAGYRMSNIDLIRVHDNYGPGDFYANFTGSHRMADGSVLSDAPRSALAMFPKLDASSTAAESYNFAPTDKLIQSIKSVGASPLFRIGASAGQKSGVPNDFKTDADYDHYADIARHVVLHYNMGWDQGFKYGIRYWEVLNEPDGHVDAQKYYKLYAKLAGAVKSADPRALIGGPALMFANNGPSYNADFLAYLRSSHLPLDFWSFHDYAIDSADPLLYSRIARNYRELLDTYGFKKTKIIISEWNVLGIDPQLLTLAGRAAFIASAIMYMQDSPIDEQTFYMGPNLFGEDGKSPNKVGQALVALGRFKDTPVGLAVTGGDDQGLAVKAGKSADGSQINVLISNYEVPESLRGPRPGGDRVVNRINLLPRRTFNYKQNDGFALNVSGLDPKKTYMVQRYRISDVFDYRLESTVMQKGDSVRVSDLLPPPGIELITISPAPATDPAH